MRRTHGKRAFLTGTFTVLSVMALRLTAGCAPPAPQAATSATAAATPVGAATTPAGAATTPAGAATTPAADPARALLPIEAIWPAVGIIVKLRDGRLFTVHGGSDWPTFLSDEKHIYAPTDPVYADMLASLRAVRGGPQISSATVTEAIQLLTLGPIVVDPAWDDLAIVRIARTGLHGFELSLMKHGVALSARVWRTANHDYREDYQHSSSGWIESYRPDPTELATHLTRARLGAGVDSELRDQVIRLLRKPTATTPGPDEP